MITNRNGNKVKSISTKDCCCEAFIFNRSRSFEGQCHDIILLKIALSLKSVCVP